MNSTDPVALVTGASRGIGRGIALELARANFHVALNYARNGGAAEETAALCRGANRRLQFPTIQANIASSVDRRRAIEFVRERFGRLDLLVNNAGIAPRARADLLETTEESFDELLETNAKAPFFLTQLAARWMISLTQSLPPARYAPKIIFISSVSAYAASVNRAEYCVSKAALAMMTRLFAARLASHGIAVFEIRPGIIATDMTAPAKEKYDGLIQQGLTPIARWGAPRDVGCAVAALAQNCFPFSTGDVFNVDGGFHLRQL